MFSSHVILPFLLTSYHPEKYQLVSKQKNYVSAMPRSYRLFGYIFTYTDKSLFTRSLEADLMFGNVFISSPFGNIYLNLHPDQVVGAL